MRRMLLTTLVMAALFAVPMQAQEWTWMGGSKVVNQTGVYGTMGTPDATNYPGSRYGHVTWTDHAGCFWMFGGRGYSIGSLGLLNDLWKYDPSTGFWTWMKGASTTGATGVYGTLSTPDVLNTPSARYFSTAWIDASGDLWLFGGSNGSNHFNDLWKYTIANGAWTWMSGSNQANQSGNYGTIGVPLSTNTPGARRASISWVDNDGKFWIFGGLIDYGTTWHSFNDLWQYDPLNGLWTWKSGATSLDQYGNFGSIEVSSSTNIPGSRGHAVSWIDQVGNLWLFSGNGNGESTTGRLNDIWKYDISSGMWTWTNGSKNINEAGEYGTLGISSPTNLPGARTGAAFWPDGRGNLYVHGGLGYAASVEGELNDMWRCNIQTGSWTWIAGSSQINVAGEYGTIQTPSQLNYPGGRRFYPGYCVDGSGNVWAFGGFGYGESQHDYLNDLWRFSPCPPLACGTTIIANTTLCSDMDCSSITGAAITIGVSDVTLDLNGHTITTGTGQVGVLLAPGVSNVTITNGKIDGPGTAIKIQSGCAGVSITEMDLTLSGSVAASGNGIEIVPGATVTGVTISNTIVSNRVKGFFSVPSSNITNLSISGSTFDNNTEGMH
ncbi:MAG: hypothetical protein IH600_12870, partial [Bacteroidetes bacterium]|nr:hypothetical protein [Bacteroidota bacterium]